MYRPPYLLGALALLCVACGTDVTEPAGTDASGRIRAIEIAANGAPVGSIIRAGALGSHVLQAVAVGADGGRTILGDAVDWGSTQPSVAEAFETAGLGYISVRRNGRASIIAQLGALRDTVTFEVAQVAVGARAVTDTLVALTEDARDIAGGAERYDTLRFAAVRVDSNGFVVASDEPIGFEVSEGAPFNVIAEQRGDTARIIGASAGSGKLFIRLGSSVDTVVVQVAKTYRVVRLIETANGGRYVSPDTATISAGTAVIFQNEAPFVAYIGGSGTAHSGWRAGPIPILGREAQLFSAPETYLYVWAGGERAVVVLP